MSRRLDLIRVDAEAPVALATQVSRQLGWLIASGALAPDDQLPPVRELAAQLGINLHTVRAAYQQLAADGLITTRRGRRAAVLGYDRIRVAAGAPDLPSFTIGVVIPGFAPFYASMLDGIEAISADHDALVFICNAREDPNATLSYLDRFIAQQVDGIIIASPLLPDDAALPPPEYGPPIVFIDHPDAPGPSVEFDLEGSSFQATRHMIEHGHRRLGYLTPPTEWPNVAPKYAGFRRALESAGIAPDPRLVASVPDFSLESGHQGTTHLLDQLDPPTCIVAASDALALGAIRSIASRGLHIPDDLALVGNDDIDVASIVRPSLTTVALPVREAGVQAATMLHQLIAGQSPETTRLLLDTHLVVRESCGCSDAVEGLARSEPESSRPATGE